MSTGRAIQRFYDHHLADLQVNLGEATLLALIVEAGPLNQVELAKRLDTGKGTTAVRVDALAKRGAAERQPDPTDRRAWLVVATPEGVRLARAINRIDEELRSLLRHDVSRDERRIYADIASRVRSNIDRALVDDSSHPGVKRR